MVGRLVLAVREVLIERDDLAIEYGAIFAVVDKDAVSKICMCALNFQIENKV